MTRNAWLHGVGGWVLNGPEAWSESKRLAIRSATQERRVSALVCASTILQPVQRVVQAMAREEFLVCADLTDLAVVHDDDAVGMLDG